MVDLRCDSAIEVLSAADVPRRRHWGDADKLRIVEKSFVGQRQVTATARRYGISRSMLTVWRRQYRRGELGRAYSRTLWRRAHAWSAWHVLHASSLRVRSSRARFFSFLMFRRSLANLPLIARSMSNKASIHLIKRTFGWLGRNRRLTKGFDVRQYTNSLS